MNINYSVDNEITNFREIGIGNIKKGIIYRGSYPFIINDEKRNKIYSKLVLDAGINCIVNLSDNLNDIENIADFVPWYNDLLTDDKIIGLDIQYEFDFSDNFGYEVFNYRLRQGFEFIINHDGPYLVHCKAGIDRTGFVSAIIGLLFGASIDNVIYDYLLSYGKKFADDKNEKQNYITGRTIYDQINTIINDKIKDSDNLQKNIEQYFLNDIGLTIKQVELLKKILNN